ncbi:unnamed protein product [Cylindrotheca closterium]|uniref:Uncharacterized protein n=1 Tax=Cylindrotheca closterium TaxID=2856 RepID=A0AAD2CSI5_9STRA|nr:unnamed protein product [Cylindrotheca closterium]
MRLMIATQWTMRSKHNLALLEIHPAGRRWRCKSSQAMADFPTRLLLACSSEFTIWIMCIRSTQILPGFFEQVAPLGWDKSYSKTLEQCLAVLFCSVLPWGC